MVGTCRAASQKQSMRLLKQSIFKLQYLLLLFFDSVLQVQNPLMLLVDFIYKHLNHEVFLAAELDSLVVVSVVLNFLLQIILHFGMIGAFLLELFILRPVEELR